MQASERCLAALQAAAMCARGVLICCSQSCAPLLPFLPFLPPVPVSDMLRPSGLRVSPTLVHGRPAKRVAGGRWIKRRSTAITQIESTGPARPRPRRGAHASASNAPPPPAVPRPRWLRAGSVLAPCWLHAGSMLAHAGSCWLMLTLLASCWLHAGSTAPTPPAFWLPSFHAPTLLRSLTAPMLSGPPFFPFPVETEVLSKYPCLIRVQPVTFGRCSLYYCCVLTNFFFSSFRTNPDCKTKFL
jgi:hypothetical protein